MSSASDRKSSLEIIEDFYGEQISLELVPWIRQTPLEQLAVLADRLDEHAKRTEDELARRPSIRAKLPASGEQTVDHPIFIHDASFLHAGQANSIAEAPELKHGPHGLVPLPGNE